MSALGNFGAGARRTLAAGPPCSNRSTEVRWWGFEDARRGLPYHHDYDTWSKPRQLNYERGRHQWAMAHSAMGGTAADMLHTPVTRWPRNMRLRPHLARLLGPDEASRIIEATTTRAIEDLTAAANTGA